jgi:hypothetical protein
MDWKEFFKLRVYLESGTRRGLWFEAELPVQENFSVGELLISRFAELRLSVEEKKKLTLGQRKILLCHEAFASEAFGEICQRFQHKLMREKAQHLRFSTEGGGVYLFLALGSSLKLAGKQVVCHTSELPLPVVQLAKRPPVQLVFRPTNQAFLADFPSLWQKSELMGLFEVSGKKSRVA